MPLGKYSEQRGGRRWGPLSVSLAIHSAAFVAFTSAPSIQLPHAAESEYKQKIAGKEEKLVWYKFRELPHVTPPSSRRDSRPLRAAVVAKQSIVSSPKNAPRRNQMVWTPAPQVAATPPLESPNLLAIKLPDPPVKPFVTPPDLTPKEAPKIDVPDAPQLKADPLKTADLNNVRLPPKPFAAPPQIAQTKIAQIKPIDEAPELAAKVIPATGVNVPASKLPPRPFTAPSRSTASTPSKNVDIPDLPATDSPLNVAIVGLNPLDKAMPLPAAPSPATFSAGPKVRPDGATADGAGKGLTVPDLFVRGPNDPATDPIGPAGSNGKGTAGSDLIRQAYAAPTSSETLRAAMRQGEPVMIAHVDPSPGALAGAAKVSSAPDPRFNGRDVYMMAIQMPNITSYSGSWLMWYASRTQRELGLAPIAPPVVHRKVDPKYSPALVAERVEGKVQLACVIDEAGKVSNVEVVRGADTRLNEAAEQALAKWEFYPATRHGEPVEVDVLVEIPFTLAPPIPFRR